jgi:hypothetical protein
MRNVIHIRGSANETEEQTMRTALRFRGLAVLLVALMTSSAWADNYSDTVDSSAWADNYSDTVEVFKNAIPSSFFETSYGYAVFPTIGKGGVGIGGAHGKGQVYAKGVHVGDTSMTQLTIGFQLGGQAFSQIIFFEDERAFTGICFSIHNRSICRCQWRKKRCQISRWVSPGDGHIYRRQGWLDVRSRNRWTEVYVQER